MSITHIFPGAEVIPSPWFGYPTIGAARRVKPTILAVLHVTDGLSSAADTTRWGISTKGKSWTFCVDRNGHVVQSLDPVTQTPWTNGDTKTPDMSNPVIAAAVKSGRNMNEACFLTIENVGTPDANPITDAQRASIRQILAWAAPLAGLPIDRTRVIGHYQVNSVTRSNCPVLPAQRAAFFADVLRANQEEDMKWRQYARIIPLSRLTLVDGAIPYAGPGREYGEHSPGFKFGAGETVLTALEVILPDHAGHWFEATRRVVPVGTEPAPGTFWIANSDQSAIEAVATDPGTQIEATDALRLRIDGIKAKVAALAADVADD